LKDKQSRLNDQTRSRVQQPVYHHRQIPLGVIARAYVEMSLPTGLKGAGVIRKDGRVSSVGFDNTSQPFVSEEHASTESLKGIDNVQKCIITISSTDEDDSAKVSLEFDPPIKNDDHAITAVESLAMTALEAMTGAGD
jgi:hypothetical protein